VEAAVALGYNAGQFPFLTASSFYTLFYNLVVAFDLERERKEVVELETPNDCFPARSQTVSLCISNRRRCP
jgi:hypothetical protein